MADMGDVGRVLNQDELVLVLHRYRDLLVDDEVRLNALNVFPLADRDTGTNLVRTVSSLVERLETGAGSGPLGRRGAVAALESARGNSGLIASQYLAGLLAEVGVADAGEGDGAGVAGGVGAGSERPDGPLLDGTWLAAALARAAVDARSAVADPVEGTMITVGDRVAAVVSAAAVSGEPDLVGLATVALGAATVAVAATPSQLPVLAEAGVVDAGGAGLALLFRALVDQLRGADHPSGAEHLSGADQLSAPDAPTRNAARPVVAAHPPLVSGGGASASTLVGFELQFTFDSPSAVADVVRWTLGRYGRDVVVTWADGVGRAHVHLDGPELGPALEATVTVVEPRNIGVEPLVETIGP